MKGFIEFKHYVSVLLLAGLLAGCGGGGSSITDTGDGTDTGDVTDTINESQIIITHPDTAGIIAHAEHVDGIAQMDVFGDKASGKISKLTGAVEERTFEIQFNDNTDNKYIIGDSSFSYSINANDTINFKFFIGNILQFEKNNVVVDSSQVGRLESNRWLSSRASEEECRMQRGVIATVVVILMGRASIIDRSGVSEHDVLIHRLLDLLIIKNPALGVAIDQYKLDCMVTATEQPVIEPPLTGWVRPTVNFNFVLNIDNTDLKSIYDDIFFGSSCADSYDRSMYVEGDTFCNYTNDYLSYGSTSYDEGDYKTYTYYDNGRGIITQYGESATLSRNRTYSLTINIINQDGVSEEEPLSFIARIEVRHAVTGVIFIEHYDKNGSLTQTCLPKENSTTETTCTRY